MTDLERLDEALGWLDQHHGTSAGALIAAQTLRAYRDLLANGERVEWCETHAQVAWLSDPGGYCRVAWEDGAHEDCRIGDKLLSDYPKEADDD